MLENQVALPIEVEKFTAREIRIRALLREYLKMPRRIEYLQRLANGDGLIAQPSVTVSPPSEDDPWILAELSMDILSDAQAEIVQAVVQHVKADDLIYATSSRIAARLRNTFADDKQEDELLQMFNTMLMEHIGEERVELTDTERTAIRRDVEIVRARQKLATIQEQKQHLDFALDTMRQYEAYYHDILWNRYVLDKPVPQVCEVVGLLWPTQDKTYQRHLRQGMEELARWIPHRVL